MKDFKFDQPEKDKIGDMMYGALGTDTIDFCIQEIESLIQSRPESIHPTPSDPSQDSVAGVSADISVSDLRKVFAHRSSRIVEDLNQGANQLMTLTDFRLAVADMGWRIGFDQLADKDREILHLNDVIKSAQAEVEEKKTEVSRLINVIESYDDELTASKAEVERLKQTVAECEGAIKDMRH